MGAIAYVLDWPAWTGYGIVAIICLADVYVLVQFWRGRLANIRALPKRTEAVMEKLA